MAVVRALLNREGGTLRTTDLDALSERMTQVMQAAGHQIDIELLTGDELESRLDDAIADDRVDTVLVGGGDGTVSGAAARLMNTGKTLAILPAGTMNLFARSLGIPLNLDRAMEALASAPVSAVDVATANGRAFVHQYSVGLHAELVKRREERSFSSRLGKMRASAQAAVSAVLDPPRLKVRIELGSGETVDARTSSIGITNNLFGEGHLPYSDTPDGGVLGIYVTKARLRREFLSLAVNMALGRWRENNQVAIYSTTKALLMVGSRHKGFVCVIDGELGELEAEVEFELHARCLNVLRPDAG